MTRDSTVSLAGCNSPNPAITDDSVSDMPKKQKLSEPEIQALIVKEAKYRLGCKDFEPDFTLHRVEDDRSGIYPHANWDVQSIRSADAWQPDCAQAFKEAVARARGKFDIAWIEATRR